MRKSDVISVNPGQIAEGARFPDLCIVRKAIPRKECLNRYSDNHLVNFLFPTSRAGVGFSLATFLLRAAIAWILMFVALPAPAGVASQLMSTIYLSLGIVFAAGLLTRPFAIFSTIYFAMLIISGIGQTMVYPALVLAFSAILSLVGPGRLSVDRIIGLLLSRKDKSSRSSMTYKSYSSL